MKSILLIGLGRFGRHVAMKLYDLDHQILAIDTNEERVNEALPFVTNALIGDSTKEDFLDSLGIRNFDTCIVAIGDNFQNSIVTTSLLKQMGAKKVVARASYGVQEQLLLKNGADEVVYPEKQLASWIAIRSTTDHILDYFELDKNYSIFEIEVPISWTNKTIAQLDLRKKFGINILGIRDNGKLNMDINPEMVLDQYKSVLVLGSQKAVQKCFHI